MTLYEFYGDGCPHCEKMKPKVERLKDEGFEVKQKEVWNNQENAELMDKHDDNGDGEPLCGGVPFFYNTETEQWICGEAEFEKLKTWAEGGDMN